MENVTETFFVNQVTSKCFFPNVTNFLYLFVNLFFSLLCLVSCFDEQVSILHVVCYLKDQQYFQNFCSHFITSMVVLKEKQNRHLHTHTQNFQAKCLCFFFFLILIPNGCVAWCFHCRCFQKWQ